MNTGKKTITLSQVENLLDEGFTREEMVDQLGISAAEVKSLFSHPKLKGRKPKAKASYIFIDDSVEETKEGINEEVQDAVENVAVEAVEAVEETNDVVEDPSPVVDQPTAIEQDAADMAQEATAPEPSPATQAWTN